MCDDEHPARYGLGRMTKQRAAIARTVARMQCAFTVDELARAATDLGEPISTATTYRAVSAMEGSGHLERVGSRDGSALYALCDHDTHHHHIVCERCGRTEPTECPVGPSDLPRSEHGFRVTRHEVTLYGVCEQCDAPADLV